MNQFFEWIQAILNTWIYLDMIVSVLAIIVVLVCSLVALLYLLKSDATRRHAQSVYLDPQEAGTASFSMTPRQPTLERRLHDAEAHDEPLYDQ